MDEGPEILKGLYKAGGNWTPLAASPEPLTSGNNNSHGVMTRVR